MRILVTILAGTTLAISAGAAVAQDWDQPRAPLPYDRGYDLDTPRTRAINDAERPAVEAANSEALAEAAAQTAREANGSAQYARDLAAYNAELRGRDQTIAADDAYYARQRRAYADAMADWRMQVEDCRRGIRAACNAPTPDPANY